VTISPLSEPRVSLFEHSLSAKVFEHDRPISSIAALKPASIACLAPLPVVTRGDKGCAVNTADYHSQALFARHRGILRHSRELAQQQLSASKLIVACLAPLPVVTRGDKGCAVTTADHHFQALFARHRGILRHSRERALQQLSALKLMQAHHRPHIGHSHDRTAVFVTTILGQDSQ